MKIKDIFAVMPLPLYEVTEMTKDEALLAITDYRGDETKSGILSNEILNRYYREPSANQQRH